MAATTRVDSAYGQIYHAILNGEHAPGSKLNSVQLQERYGLSTGVLREVFNRLMGNGLVTAEPQRGFRVLDISLPDVEQLTEALVLVEKALIRQAIDYGDLEFEAELAAAHHRLAKTPHTDSTGHTTDAWRAAHAEFHAQLLAGAQNERLKAIAISLRNQSEIYRSWSFSVGRDLTRDVELEHLELLRAVLERDQDRAELAVTQHAERTRDALLAATSWSASEVRR